MIAVSQIFKAERISRRLQSPRNPSYDILGGNWKYVVCNHLYFPFLLRNAHAQYIIMDPKKKLYIGGYVPWEMTNILPMGNAESTPQKLD